METETKQNEQGIFNPDENKEQEIKSEPEVKPAKEKKAKKEVETETIPYNPVDVKIAKAGTNLTPEQVAIIKNTVARNTTNTELAFFLNVCHMADLNPFLKEIWCYKDKIGNLIVFGSRDGFLKKAQRDPAYAGLRSIEVCENDPIFELDIPAGKVAHKIDFKKPRGKIIGAYAIAFRKDGEPTIEWADIHTYDKGQFTWSTHKSEMIKKVAEVHALKKAFGIASLQSEYDFEIKGDRAIPIQASEQDARDFSDDAPAQEGELPLK